MRFEIHVTLVDGVTGFFFNKKWDCLPLWVETVGCWHTVDILIMHIVVMHKSCNA